MSLLALVAWISTAGVGLYLLLPAVHLADRVRQGLSRGGLLVWASYLLWNSFRMAWIAVATLGLAATLGLVMAVRWVGVYRAGRQAALTEAGSN